MAIILTMKLIGTAKLARGKKVQILSEAIDKLGWEEGEQLVELVSDDNSFLYIRRLDDVVNGEKIKGEEGNELDTE